MEKVTGKGHRLLLMPLPFQGHITPLLHLGDILYSKGFSITIIHTSFNSPDPSTHPHFTFLPIHESLSESEASSIDSLHLVDLINVRIIQPLKECLDKLMRSKEETVSCFIADAVLHSTQSVCDGFKLRRLVLRTGGATSFVVFASIPLLRENGYFPIQESRLDEPVVELPPLKVKDLPWFETRDPELFYNLTSSIFDSLKASSGVIWNTFEELESSTISKFGQEFSIPIYPIGPFHKHHFPKPSSSFTIWTPDTSCISWLDTKEPKSVVYVSFGSIASITEAEFLELAWGLAHSNHPFLWVVRPGLVRGSEWLELLPDGFMESLGGRGCIVKWAPQEKVLGHEAIGAFWTHCGWNSTLESVCEGVPMICMPCFGDQKVNAKYVSDVWKVGVKLEGKVERIEIERVIKRIMSGDEGKEIRENVLNLKEKANLCLKEGGSSYNYLDALVNAM
ncbi:UDP-glycosyltransferase 76F1 [Arachis hypogaea]|uniref:UDP-glycosyltransferase 76F1 n=1 Tax=Arachis hypogaea TaxID=3818 RepID=UPI000DEC6C22|nr:UDP-glycosyltransferase 76F1 [Arachis hypogaea]QHO15937.1 UDP-glycosyltransferase [Arachis hypogaea]